jgi:DNA repair exonuclease
MKHILKYAIVLSLFLLALAPSIAAEAEGDAEVPRIVLLGDPHLPYKTFPPTTKAAGEALVAAKEGVIADINGWSGVTRVVALGDLVGMRGTKEEYDFASEVLGCINAPFVPIAGNHDYIYKDEAGPLGVLVRGSPDSRKEKLDLFVSAFRLPSLQREESIAGYELVYLSTDSTERKYEVGLSSESLRWLEETLARTSSMPTIIFYHAPLAGTIRAAGLPTSPASDAAAQPSEAIAEILKHNPQVFLWVSGHTHTQPSNPDFDSPLNLYDGRVTDIHCPDLGHKRIYTNSLWLYPDRVLVRTFDHGAKDFVAKFDRVIPAPVAPAEPAMSDTSAAPAAP